MMSMWLFAGAACAALLLWRGAAFAAEGDAAAPAHTNALIDESSPYLLQHAHNPVDWLPWGDEAFERAAREDKPVFLSVGYSTCHWCHVMAHESFEDEAVAAILNDRFICIKVDREQLPDVDELYMLATQMFTGRGGWPNSVWLLPDRRPWFAGTYFPRDRFVETLNQLHVYWTGQREQVELQAEQVAAAIRRYGEGTHLWAAERPLSRRVIEAGAEQIDGMYDAERGGFGAAPKFPPHGQLALLLHLQGRGADERRARVIDHTLTAMYHGGMYDQVGGGFHRYSTDARWLLPHFEKMLYDNAQLVDAYARAYALREEPTYRRAIAETFAWLGREMRDPAGGFYSAIDADSEGEEGRFYVWTTEEVRRVLGEDDAAVAIAAYSMTDAGNFVEESTRRATGANVPHIGAGLGEAAAALGMDEAALRERLDEIDAKLLAARGERVRPHLDDKVLTGWNGLMIGALANAGRVLDEPGYTRAAVEAAGFILSAMRDGEGRLLRAWRGGAAAVPAYLDDYAYLAQGLLDLHAATGEARWLDEARAIADAMIERFSDPAGGGLFLTAADHDALLLRSKASSGGGNVPSPNGIAAQVLVRLAEVTGEMGYARLAAGILHEGRAMMWSNPHAAEHHLVALAMLYEGIDAGRITGVELPSDAADEDADAVAGRAEARVSAYLSSRTIRPGDAVHLAVRLDVERGWHIYGPDTGGTAAMPTAIALGDGAPAGVALEVAGFSRPTRKRDAVFEADLDVYEDRAFALATITVPEGAAAGVMELPVSIAMQACSDERRVCIDATAELTLALTVDPGAGEPTIERHPHVFEVLGLRQP